MKRSKSKDEIENKLLSHKADLNILIEMLKDEVCKLRTHKWDCRGSKAIEKETDKYFFIASFYERIPDSKSSTEEETNNEDSSASINSCDSHHDYEDRSDEYRTDEERANNTESDDDEDSGS